MPDSDEAAGAEEPSVRKRASPRAAAASTALAWGAGAVMLGVGCTRLLRDGSLWLDEASVAVNLLTQSPVELFGPYLTGHSFPRLYLVPIALLQSAFGYSTALLRLLPFLAFAGGVVLWLRLAHQRFRHSPLLLALLLVLSLIPATWIAYSVMLKQYSLDVMLALVPFVLSDRFFEETLREGRGRGRLIALVLPCLLSFTYVIPLLARVLGFGIVGWARGQRHFDRRAAGALGGAFVVALLAMWLIDLRHTAGSESLFRFWSKCIPAADWSRTPALLLDLHAGWYRHMPFGPKGELPGPVIGLLGLAGLLGAFMITRRSLVGDDASDPDRALFGSRGAGCLLVILGLVAASLIVRYPLCPGRLTLFALFAIQIVTLEGFASAQGQLGKRGRMGRVAAVSLLVASIALCLPTALRTIRFMAVRDSPENIRPLLHHLDEAPELPILVAACSTRQISTLPELFDDERVLYYDERVALGRRGWPDSEEFWVLSTGSRFYCPWFFRSMNLWADEVTSYAIGKIHTASLWRVRMRVPKESQHP